MYVVIVLLHWERARVAHNSVCVTLCCGTAGVRVYGAAVAEASRLEPPHMDLQSQHIPAVTSCRDTGKLMVTIPTDVGVLAPGANHVLFLVDAVVHYVATGNTAP